MDLDVRIKAISLWNILKELPFDGGPSSTRFVFLAWFAVAAVGYLGVVGGFVYVYVRDPLHPAGTGILAVITLLSSVPAGMAANSQNTKNQLASRLPSSSSAVTSTVGAD